MWFLFVSTDTAVWLTSVLTSQLATLPLAWLPGTTPALTGLSPIGRHRLADGEAFGTLNFMSYIHRSRHTPKINCIETQFIQVVTSKPKKCKT